VTIFPKLEFLPVKGVRQIYGWAQFLSRCPIFPEIFPLITKEEIGMNRVR
jgi:hypothetical protein